MLLTIVRVCRWPLRYLAKRLIEKSTDEGDLLGGSILLAHERVLTCLWWPWRCFEFLCCKSAWTTCHSPSLPNSSVRVFGKRAKAQIISMAGGGKMECGYFRAVLLLKLAQLPAALRESATERQYHQPSYRYVSKQDRILQQCFLKAHRHTAMP